MPELIFEGAASVELSDVERGPDGLPVAWPLLHKGDNHLTIQGRPATLRLTGEDIDRIVSYHNDKGAKIPIDSRHVLSNLARKVGVDEAEILRRLPRLAGTAGFGRLERRGDALYLSDAEFLPIAADVMREGMIRYFSPTVRGLDGKSPLRVTSVALDNEPCLQRLASLAAAESGEDEDAVTPAEAREAIDKLTHNKEGNMPDEITKAETKPSGTDKPEAPKGADGELLAILREVLGENVTPETLKSTLAALKVQADKMPELQKQVENLQLAEENRKLETARERGLKAGKLTPALLEKPFFKSMNSVELSEYLESVPDNCAAPVAMLELGERRQQSSAAVSDKVYNSVAEAIADAPTF